jgi:predicted  nucleic acid-binding Zn-ribbon protein
MNRERALVSARDVHGTALQELFDMTQSLQYRLSTHISLSPQISQSITSQRELISQINEVFRHQQQINQMNHRIQTANFLTNMSNFARSKQLQVHHFHQVIIQRGEKEILGLTKTITSLRLEIEGLNSDIDSQRLEAQRLSTSLQNTQETLKRAIITYRNELDEQKRVLEQQGEQLDTLLRARIRTDLILDAGFICVM